MELGPLFIGILRWAAAVGSLAFAGQRLARRRTPGGKRWTSEDLLRAILLGAAAVVVTTASCGAAGVLSAGPLLAAALGVAFLAALVPAAPRGGRPLRRASSSGSPLLRGMTALPLSLAAGIVALDAAIALPTPPTSWDAMTYHLYLPARWLQEGRIFHVPTVFTDAHPAYAPQNGALVHAWNMALSGSDLLANAVQGLAVFFAALALYRIALLLGAPRHAAAWVAPLAAALPLVRRWASTANVDVFMAAGLVGAAYWTLALCRGERGAARPAALAAGLAAGTKTAALLPAAVLLAVAAGALLRGSLPWRRRIGEVGVLAVLALAGGGFWYVRNLLLYGNPLFPLDFGVGPLHFAGAFNADALRQTFLNVDFGSWRTAVDATLGRPTWIAAVLGALLLLARRGSAAVLAVAVAAWSGYCYAVLPYNNQTRFLIPALWIALLGWPFLLRRWRRAKRGRRVRNLVGLAAVAVLVATAPPDVAWSPRLERLVAAADNQRIAFLANADFSVYAPGYLMFNDPSLPALRIAYAGTNVPYALMGPGWRHEVIYVNTRGAPGDGFYEHWRRDPRRYDTHKPGLYRGPGDDAGAWVGRLRELRIDAVAVFAHVPLEIPAHWPLDGAFPIERLWMRQRPDLFRPVVRAPQAEVYEFLGTAEKSSPAASSKATSASEKSTSRR